MLSGPELRKVRLEALHAAHYRHSDERLLESVNRTLHDLPLYQRLGYPRSVTSRDDFARLPILSKTSVIAARPSDLVGRTVSIANAIANDSLRRVASSGSRARASVWVTNEGGAFTPETNDLIMGIDHALMTTSAVWTSPQCSGTNCVIDTSAGSDLFPPTADIFAASHAYIEAIARRFEDAGRTIVMTNPVLAHELIRRLERSGRRLPCAGALTFSYQRLGELQRRRIAGAVDVPIFRHYGATELAGATVSVTCCAGTPHLWESLAHVEVVDDDGEPTSDVGRVIVTVIGSEGTKLVRYDVGDLGRLTTVECACGLPASRALDVLGRRAAAWRSGGAWVTEADLDRRLSAIANIELAVTTRTEHGLRVAVVPADGTTLHADDVRATLSDVESRAIDVVLTDRLSANAGKYPMQRRWDA